MSDKSDRRDYLRVTQISPPVISSWVRPRHVLSVEALRDVERAILWPESGDARPMQNKNVEAARAQEGKDGSTRR